MLLINFINKNQYNPEEEERKPVLSVGGREKERKRERERREEREREEEEEEERRREESRLDFFC